MLLLKKRTLLIILFLVLICVFAGSRLVFNHYSMIGKKQDGVELFSDNDWNNIKSIAFLDFDETRYETEDVKKFQDIKDIIFSSTYEEVENPEFEGGYIFEITTDKETYDLVISGNMVTINEQTYRISNKTLAKQLIEIIGLREERTYSETS